MTTETKRHIDAARQVLVGVVPNPTSQIDQITNALIYKFMDDMDQSAIKQGGDPSFFVGDLEKYAWTRLMDARIGNQERMNIYSEALIKFSESKQLPPLFREIFKSAFLPYRSPEVLGLFLKEIAHFDYSHPEELGNAYEYLLSIMSSQGDAGQFRTPRHIIDFMVDVVDPTMDDKVLDPACGTGGFLVSAYKHILEQHDGKSSDGTNNGEKPLTPDQRKNLMENFEGYDVDPGMVRIAQVNMYLHQFKNPKIFQYDTLSMEERWGDKYSVILANPPFMSPKGGVSTHKKFSIQSSRSEVLFVDYIMNHLRPQGRAGIIVPEGIIFQSGTAHKQLRKNLVEDGLYAVVSLPSGVFQPYAGVKTSILFFDNEIAKKTKHILFVKIENDGFDLGAQRRVIEKNDIPITKSILNDYKNTVVNGIGSLGHMEEFIKHFDFAHSRVSVITKEKIAEGGDYNLSGDRYRVATDYTNAKWPMVELGKIAKFIDDGDWIESKDQSESGIRLIQTGNIGIGVYLDKDGRERYVSNETFDKLKCTEIFTGDVLLSRLPDPVGRACVLPKLGERAITAVDCTIFRFNNIIMGKYFVYLTLSKEYQRKIDSMLSGATRQRISKGNLLEIQIPFPPPEIQEQIVAELDGYQNIITGAKEISTNWKPKIEIDPEWEKVKIGDVAEVQGGYAFKSQDMTAKAGAQIIKIGNVKDQKFDYQNNPSFIEAKLFSNYNDYQLSVGDILISMTGTAGKRDYGNVCVVDIEDKFLLNQRVARIIPNSKIVNTYLFFTLNQDETKDNFYLNTTGGVRQGNISNKQIESIEIYLPPLAIQKEIVEKIESERILVESAQKLIELYEQKIKDVLSKIWGNDDHASK